MIRFLLSLDFILFNLSMTSKTNDRGIGNPKGITRAVDGETGRFNLNLYWLCFNEFWSRTPVVYGDITLLRGF